jgi:hypothetical protein
LTPIIYELSGNLGTPLLVSVFVCLISLGCAITVSYLDKKADKVYSYLLSTTNSIK